MKARAWFHRMGCQAGTRCPHLFVSELCRRVLQVQLSDLPWWAADAFLDGVIAARGIKPREVQS